MSLLNTLVTLLDEVTVFVFLYISKKSQTRNIFLMSEHSKNKKSLFPSMLCVNYLVFFLYGDQCPICLSPPVPQNTFATQHRLKQRPKQGPCVFFVFFVCVLIWGFRFVSNYYTYLICPKTLLLHCLSQHLQKSIYKAHSALDTTVWVLTVLFSVLRRYRGPSVSQWRWSLRQRPLWQMTLSAHLFTATPGSM